MQNLMSDTNQCLVWFVIIVKCFLRLYVGSNDNMNYIDLYLHKNQCYSCALIIDNICALIVHQFSYKFCDNYNSSEFAYEISPYYLDIQWLLFMLIFRVKNSKAR